MIKFSLLGETILEWNDKDIEHYHARRMAMDSMLCRFKVEYKKVYVADQRSLYSMLPDGTSGRTLALLFLNIAATKKE